LKTISAGLATHLAGEVTTIATCWKATLSDGTVFGFTNHTDDLTVSSQLYKASTGQSATAIASNADLAVDNLDVIGFLDSAVITEADINRGRWDYASIEIFQVNYADLTQGTLKQRAGRLGEIRLSRAEFIAELRGLAQNLQQLIGQIYSASCRADFGDARCGLTLASYTFSGTVTTGGSTRTFTDSGRAEASDYFGAGKVTWVTGANAGYSMEVKSFAAGVFTLQLPMAQTITAGDTYTASAGCRKRFDTDCKTKFSNVVNFRGEPHVPGNDQMAKAGGQ